MADDLKPCPFCGGEARLEHIEGPHPPGKHPSCFYVQCQNYPGCSARSFGASSEKAAVAQWERRTLRVTHSEDMGYFLHMASAKHGEAGMILEPDEAMSGLCKVLADVAVEAEEVPEEEPDA